MTFGVDGGFGAGDDDGVIFFCRAAADGLAGNRQDGVDSGSRGLCSSRGRGIFGGRRDIDGLDQGSGGRIENLDFAGADRGGGGELDFQGESGEMSLAARCVGKRVETFRVGLSAARVGRAESSKIAEARVA